MSWKNYPYNCSHCDHKGTVAISLRVGGYYDLIGATIDIQCPECGKCNTVQI